MSESSGGAIALELKGAGISFGGLRAVNDVHMRVAAGSTHVVIGPNGAGKTTLFGLISGELALSNGWVYLLGQDVSNWSATKRSLAGLGRTYQITNVLAGLTVEENLLLAMRGKSAVKCSLFGSAKPSAEERHEIERLLHLSGIAGHEQERAGHMSYGRQRQLELAIALANKPRVLLLDEPAAGLSPAERGPMAKLIRELPDDLTVLLIEHDMELALGLADRVTCLYYGEVLAEGTPQEIRNNQQVQAVYFGAAEHHA